jgi:hypothetical protein
VEPISPHTERGERLKRVEGEGRDNMSSLADPPANEETRKSIYT